jgi:hypothetical protein
MLNTFEEDMKVGKEEEVSVLPFLRTYFGDDDLNLVKSEYEANDYVGRDGVKYEIKSRDLTSNSELAKEGLMINVAKVCWNDFIIWNLLDGIYYVKCDDVMGDETIKPRKHTNNVRPDERENATMTRYVYHVPIGKCICLKRYDTLRTPKEKNGGLKRGVCHINI